MDINDFSGITRECLAQAGWAPGYVCPTLDEYVAALEADGYRVHEAARAFLRGFGGLEIRFPHRGQPGATDSVSTRAGHATRSVFSDTAELWAEIVGAQLCLIGDVYGRYMGLAMDPSGRVYAGEGELVIQLGDSGADALEGLCTGREVIRIQDPVLGIYPEKK